MKNKSTNDYDRLASGEALWQKMKALFLGEKPGKDKADTVELKAEHSATVAERYATSAGNLVDAIALCEREAKQYAKFGNEKFATLRQGMVAWRKGFNTPSTKKVVEDGEEVERPITATFTSKVRTLTVESEVAFDNTMESILTILGKAPDEDLLEESVKTRRGNRERLKLLADLDSRRYGGGEHLEGGNEFGTGTAWSSEMLWDNEGRMKGVLKLTCRCTRAMDRGEKAASGEIYGVLTGDLPFRDEEGIYINLDPATVDTLIEGRSYMRMAFALRRKAKELTKILEEDKGVSEETKKIRSEVLGEVKDRIAPTPVPAAPEEADESAK